MKYDKLHFQARIDDVFSNSGFVQNNSGWDAFKLGFMLNNAESIILAENLEKDAKHFYFKGILSLVQAISDCDRKLYSWATVKLYYSVFYFLRASLCAKKEGFYRYIYRKSSSLFRLSARTGEVFYQADGRGSDHEAAISRFQNLYGPNGNNMDLIQSNDINGENSYDWLAEKRNTINYKHRTFSEPSIDELWQKVHKCVGKGNLFKLIQNYLNDTASLYCFQEEDALLALPIKRMQETKKDLLGNGIIDLIDKPKKDFLYGIKIGQDIQKKIIE